MIFFNDLYYDNLFGYTTIAIDLFNIEFKIHIFIDKLIRYIG